MVINKMKKKPGLRTFGNIIDYLDCLFIQTFLLDAIEPN